MIVVRARSVLVLLPLVLAVAGCTPPFNAFQPYLTWQGDTGTTMTVNFHTREPGVPEVYYDVVSRAGNIEAYKFVERGITHQISGLRDGRYIHTVELTSLEPGTTYYFLGRLSGDGSEPPQTTGEKSFRTIPNDGQPIRFITGGDMDLSREELQILEVASQEDPMMALIGGDIAYVNGNLRDFGKWDTWLTRWAKTMVTSEGHMIPLVLGIGNHEVKPQGLLGSEGGFEGEPEDAPFYLGYFPQENGGTFFLRTFGSNVVVYVLDSSHVAPHGGAQATWLRQAMEDHAEFTHQFALYHVPLYPSFRDFEGEYSKRGREEWGPIFDMYGLDTAFENHDHMLKRTKRMKEGQINPSGTLYLGDGCFGKAPRQRNVANLWYLDAVDERRHFWLVEVDGGMVIYTAIGIDGDVLDQHITEELPLN